MYLPITVTKYELGPLILVECKIHHISFSDSSSSSYSTRYSITKSRATFTMMLAKRYIRMADSSDDDEDDSMNRQQKVLAPPVIHRTILSGGSDDDAHGGTFASSSSSSKTKGNPAYFQSKDADDDDLPPNTPSRHNTTASTVYTIDETSPENKLSQYHHHHHAFPQPALEGDDECSRRSSVAAAESVQADDENPFTETFSYSDDDEDEDSLQYTVDTATVGGDQSARNKGAEAIRTTKQTIVEQRPATTRHRLQQGEHETKNRTVDRRRRLAFALVGVILLIVVIIALAIMINKLRAN